MVGPYTVYVVYVCYIKLTTLSFSVNCYAIKPFDAHCRHIRVQL